MAYTKEMYSKAERILEKRREKAEYEAEERRSEIISRLPEIEEIQSRLYGIGFDVSQLFLYKGDKEARINELHEKSDALIAKRNTILVSNGYSENAMNPEYTCAVCSDKGYINSRRCACHLQILKELMRQEVSKHAPLSDCTFENFSLDYYSEQPDSDGVIPVQRAEKILEASRRFAQNFSLESKNLLFLGSTGLGKTHLSLAIANTVINKGYSVCYGTSHNICQDLRAEMFGKGDDLDYSSSKVLRADLLILDDLGTEVDNPYNIAAIYNIINQRILSKLPTVISTNYDFDELLDKYDQRITSRLTGEFVQLCLVGRDIRNIK